MANPDAVKYLRDNIGRYGLEELAKQLRAAGYPEAEISAAVREVQFPQAPSASSRSGFFDFRTPRAYKSGGEKFLDFLFGFFGILILNVILGVIVNTASSFLIYSHLAYYSYPSFFGILILQILFILGIDIAAIVYFWKRRRWVAYGIIATFILGLLVILLGGFMLISLLGAWH